MFHLKMMPTFNIIAQLIVAWLLVDMSTTVLTQVVGLHSPHQIWSHLCNVYTSHAGTNKETPTSTQEFEK